MTQLRFQDLISEHHDEIHRYLWRLSQSGGGDPARDAEDLTQETFLRAFAAFDRLRPDSNVRAWLYKIATNCARTAWRRQQGRHETALDEPMPATAPDDPERTTIGRQLSEDLRRAVGALPFKQRTAITLRHLEDLSYRETAQILGCTEASARANVYQALKRLRAQLTPEEVGS